MKKILRLIKGMPLWRLALIELLLVAAIGLVDYLTGDYSILIFYVIPVALAVWLHGELGAIAISAAACFARYISDCFSYSNSTVNYSNSINDLLFLLMIGFVLSATKRLISEDKSDGNVMPATNKAVQPVIYFKNVRGLK